MTIGRQGPQSSVTGDAELDAAFSGPFTDDGLFGHSLREDVAVMSTRIVPSPESAALRFSSALRRAWQTHRPVNIGLLALSVMPETERRHWLETWIKSGASSPACLSTEGEALLESIARQLPDPSPELFVCRLEQLIIRAHNHAPSFQVPDIDSIDLRRRVRRSSHAGLVLFTGDVRTILNAALNAVLQPVPLPRLSPTGTGLLVAPGLGALCRIASAEEQMIWQRLASGPIRAAHLQAGGSCEGVETLIQVGALEYA